MLACHLLANAAASVCRIVDARAARGWEGKSATLSGIKSARFEIQIEIAVLANVSMTPKKSLTDLPDRAYRSCCLVTGHVLAPVPTKVRHHLEQKFSAPARR